MATKPSAAPWADQPYALLSSTNLNKSKDAHSAHRCTIEMVHAHNCLLRGLNSILQQAPFIPDSSQSNLYVAEDVTDLLLYTEAWVRSLEHHHDVEESVFFPALQQVEGVPKDLFENSLQQHAMIHDGLTKLLNYTTSAAKQPAEYRWTTLKDLLESFGPVLYEHLNEEIEILLKLEQYDSQAIWECWQETEKRATADANLELLYNVFPGILGASDKTYEGGNEWPVLPAIMPYAIKYWFARRRKGAWRFCPCDFSCQPRPLQMLPTNRSTT